MNLMAGNRDPIAFDQPEEFIPERWLNGRKGRTDLPGEGGEKLGVAHLTYGCGRRVCPGIDSTCCTEMAMQIQAQLTCLHHSGQPRSLLNAGASLTLLHLGAPAPR